MEKNREVEKQKFIDEGDRPELTVDQLRDFKNILLSRRTALLKSLSDLREGALIGDTPEALGELSAVKLHPADLGSETADQERRLKIAGIEEDEVIEIDAAILRFENGSYGTCQSCEEPISLQRLTALPQARYCVRCQRLAEQRELKS